MSSFWTRKWEKYGGACWAKYFKFSKPPLLKNFCHWFEIIDPKNRNEGWKLSF